MYISNNGAHGFDNHIRSNQNEFFLYMYITIVISITGTVTPASYYYM